MRLIEAIAGECDRISSCVLELREDEFEQPTRCPAWNVKELLAHLYRDIEQVATFVGLPPAESVDCDAVAYWGMYDPAASAPNIADRAKSRAAAYATAHELARVWTWMWPRALDDAAAEPDDRLVVTWGPGMLLSEFLRTRLVEVVIHGLDLAVAVGREPWVHPEASAEVRAILTARLDATRPAELGWDDVTLIEKTSDRRALTPDERAILGEAADRLPLLG